MQKKKPATITNNIQTHKVMLTKTQKTACNATTVDTNRSKTNVVCANCSINCIMWKKSDDGNKLNEAKVVMCARVNEQTGHSHAHIRSII